MQVPVVTSGNSINDDAYKESGTWYFTYAVSDLPYISDTYGSIVETIRAKQSTSRALQRITYLRTDLSPLIFIRTISSSANTWGPWYKIEPASL